MSLIIHNDHLTKLDELAVIMEKHQNRSDGYSRDLFAWSADVLALSASIDDRERFYQSVHQKVTTLFRTILVNPLNPERVLVAPYLDRKWVWEKSYLDAYVRVMKGTPDADLCPFDDKPMVPEPHQFAIDVMAWARSVTQVNRQEKDEKEAAGDATKAVMRAEKVQENDYIIMARIMMVQKAIQAKKLERLKNKMLRDKQADTEQNRQINEKIEAAAAAAKQRAAEQVQAINNRIDGLQRTQAATLDGFRTQLGGLSRAFEEGKRRLADSEVKVGTLQGENANMKNRLQQLAAQLNQMTQAAPKRKKFLGIF